LPEAGADTVTWEFIRASGLAAYTLLTASVALGLSVSTRATDPVSKRAHVNEGHQTVSILAGAMIGLHMVLLLFHDYIRFGVPDILIPFASDWQPLPVAMGIVATYLVVALLVSSAVRSHIGYSAWRTIHYAAFAAWALAAVHGVFSGSDSGSVLVQYLYIGSVAIVMLLLVFGALGKKGQVPRASR
jgi:predicted ferric reductase